MLKILDIADLLSCEVGILRQFSYFFPPVNQILFHFLDRKIDVRLNHPSLPILIKVRKMRHIPHIILAGQLLPTRQVERSDAIIPQVTAFEI